MTTARPILFSAPMIRALLAGTKTQTRRTVKPQPDRFATSEGLEDGLCSVEANVSDDYPTARLQIGRVITAQKCPYGKPGDLLWVRESVTRFDRGTCDEHIWYRAGRNGDTCSPRTVALAGGADCEWPKGVEGPGGGAAYHVPSIHMPRWASRLTLELTGVRVESLQDMATHDSIAEGLVRIADDGEDGGRWGVDALPLDLWHVNPVMAYAALWDHINGAGAWDQNPWVWALTFRVHKINVNAFLSTKRSEAA